MNAAIHIREKTINVTQLFWKFTSPEGEREREKTTITETDTKCFQKCFDRITSERRVSDCVYTLRFDQLK